MLAKLVAFAFPNNRSVQLTLASCARTTLVESEFRRRRNITTDKTLHNQAGVVSDCCYRVTFNLMPAVFIHPWTAVCTL